jgi:hypothetical protein
MTWVMAGKFTRRSAAQTSCAGGLGWKGKGRGNDMASTKRIIRKALVEVLQSERATFEERIKAARMLLSLAKAGNSPSRGAKKKAQVATNLDDILSGMTDMKSDSP